MNQLPVMNVAVVGAGPAGTWAALKLARAGVSVTVFDPSHPREKPCGGGVTGRAVELILDELGAWPVPVIPVRAARFERAMASPAESAPVRQGHAAVVRLLDRGLSASSSLLVASRAVFDRALLEAAIGRGATFIAERVIDVECDANGALIRTRSASYRADFVLGADGTNSLVRRRMATPFTRHQISIGAGYFVHGVSSHEIAIRWVSNPPGYLWSFPRPDHLAVGMCAQSNDAHDVGDLRRQAAGWIAAADLAREPVRRQPYAWPIPSLNVEDFSNLALAADRWMLLGDAAGLVDPLTREGIYYALQSAEMAAAVIAGGERSPAAAYRARVAASLIPELRRAAALKRGFFSAGFSPLVVQALSQSAAIRSVMRDLIGGRQPYIGLRRRLLATWRFDLALEVLRRGWTFARAH
jgi:geranylgeranyl reductase family protein